MSVFTLFFSENNLFKFVRPNCRDVCVLDLKSYPDPFGPLKTAAIYASKWFYIIIIKEHIASKKLLKSSQMYKPLVLCYLTDICMHNLMH